MTFKWFEEGVCPTARYSVWSMRGTRPVQSPSLLLSYDLSTTNPESSPFRSLFLRPESATAISLFHRSFASIGTV